MRKFALSLAIASLGLCAALPTQAQEKFDRPVRILVGFAAGGTADLMARLVADKMKDTMGQTVLVENRPGAAGRVAADAVKAAPADGATIMVMPIGPMAVVPHTTTKLSFDPLKDFAPIGIGSTFDFAVAVGPQSGTKTWNEFVAWAKANPGKASYATSGSGSLPHFFGVQIGKETGVDMVHVAYKGSAAFANDLIGGQIPAAIDTVADLSEMHKAGRVRILATSGPQRSNVVPDVPTLTELGLRNLETGGWFGFFAHVNTPPATVQALNRHLNQALRSPDVVAKLRGVGMEPATSTPDEFKQRLAADHARWGTVVKATGFTID
ncbi:MAG TPA: Bug family tripartite tricarboxylate transporter substrate binding protein [Casimicrobiaceae bacterium]|nr:Bug family tripartite tricarboxylate transporter substrate binding protein [Casimicrobiaceae bacterium]